MKTFKQHLVENYRELAKKGIGFERSVIQRQGRAIANAKFKGHDEKAVRAIDYYHPKNGEKRQGHLKSIHQDHYLVHDHQTGETHKFAYAPEF